MLSVELAKVAPSMGIKRLELGKNNMQYKGSFASGSYAVAKGNVAVNPIARLSRGMLKRIQHLSTETWLRQPTQRARDLIRPLRVWLALK